MVDLVSGLGGTAGYGENNFATTFSTLSGGSRGGNLDDGWIKVDISSVFPGGANLYGTSHTSMYIGTNGIVSFGGGVTSYTPSALTTLASRRLRRSGPISTSTRAGRSMGH